MNVDLTFLYQTDIFLLGKSVEWLWYPRLGGFLPYISKWVLLMSWSVSELLVVICVDQVLDALSDSVCVPNGPLQTS